MRCFYELGKIFNCTFKRHFSSYRLKISNFDDYFAANFNEFSRSISQRRRDINTEILLDRYRKYVKVMSDLKVLTEEKVAIVEQMSAFVKQKNAISGYQDDLKAKGRLVRQRLKELAEVENNLKEEFVPLLQTIPALLNPDTPQDDRILYESGTFDTGKNHIQLCGQNIKLRTHSLDSKRSLILAFLMGDVAVLENKLYDGLLDRLNGIGKYRRLIHPDMVKEFVVHACLERSDELLKVVHNPADESDSSQQLILTGSSLPGFLSYISTIDIQSIKTPMKFFSMGRNYAAGGNPNHGLYDLSQTLQAELFDIATDRTTSNLLFEEQMSLATNLYKDLGLPFKIVEVAARSLSLVESQRTDFYVWSPGFNQYFKCGHIRSLSDHVSRKLSFLQSTSGTFLNMNHGVVFKLPTIMASLIEKEQTDKISPKHNIWSSI